MKYKITWLDPTSTILGEYFPPGNHTLFQLIDHLRTMTHPLNSLASGWENIVPEGTVQFKVELYDA